MAKESFEFFEHTADVGLNAYGATLAELFANAARGLVAVIAEESKPEPSQTRAIELEASSLEALLLAWLKELIVWFDADRFLPAQFRFEKITVTQLRGWVDGERFDPARHQAGTEVKGVTRHQFRVVKGAGGWEARIIFDV